MRGLCDTMQTFCDSLRRFGESIRKPIANSSHPSELGALGFSIGKCEKRMDISEAFEACELKVGRYRQLIVFMKVYEY